MTSLRVKLSVFAGVLAGSQGAVLNFETGTATPPIAFTGTATSALSVTGCKNTGAFDLCTFAQLTDRVAQLESTQTGLLGRIIANENTISQLLNTTASNKQAIVVLNQTGLPNSNPGCTGLTCWDLKQCDATLPSGTYTMSDQTQRYCDMETDGGGWTMVYRYGFSDYSNFASSGNMVTPIPNWSFTGTAAPVSTTAPDDTTMGALPFADWQKYGKEFMVQSNINDWITCKEGSGSLVDEIGGTINCKNVKNVAGGCTGVVPNEFSMHGGSLGPALITAGGSLFYYWDGSSSTNWPTHDPCGTNAANQKTSVADPHGAIFVREGVALVGAGLTQDQAADSCLDIIQQDASAVSGIYWVNPCKTNSCGDSNQNYAEQVRCDMDTEGGGWTRVYRHTFTSYNDFSTGGNAVTPIPDWTTSITQVPVSVTTPVWSGSNGAMPFNRWKHFGGELLVQSTINDWLKCSPGSSGKVTEEVDGKIVCANLKSTQTLCSNVVPDTMAWGGYGPRMSTSTRGSSLFYYWDGNTDGNWPTHDACGSNAANQKTGVGDPHDVLLVREHMPVHVTLGALGSKTNMGGDCDAIYSADSTAQSGQYWITANGAFPAGLAAYCNMQSDGGWTLAWSYSFSNYESFSSGNNMVTPQATWPSSSSTTAPSSTTPPTAEDAADGAIDFNLWSALKRSSGKNYWVKSNINHHLKCSDGTGSISSVQTGSMSCDNVLDVGTNCLGNAPTKMTWHANGPSLEGPSHMYYWEGNGASNWPTHDPCGTNGQSHVHNVAKPWGAIYIK
jgi:hypothetical protein